MDNLDNSLKLYNHCHINCKQVYTSKLKNIETNTISIFNYANLVFNEHFNKGLDNIEIDKEDVSSGEEIITVHDDDEFMVSDDTEVDKQIVTQEHIQTKIV